MHDFMLEMEDDDMNVILPFSDWEGLVDASEFSMGGFMMNHVFSDSENAGLDYQPPSPEVECKASIAERRAAKFGFDASRINVAKFKRYRSPNSSPARSPYLTIPPGISPAALLDSPVMLPNAEAQPSPTTGTLQFQQSNNDGFLVPNSSTSHNIDRDKGSSIPISDGVMAPSCSSTPMLSCASSAENKVPMTFKYPMDSAIEDARKICARDTSTDAKVSGKMARKNPTNTMKFRLPQLRNVKGEENKAAYNLTDVSRNGEDGYSWRKYGQKHVKGSEYPRSYYKCNNSSCSVKKKVERSHNGDITEIIYKGLHNHPKTHPRISLTPPYPSVELMETSEGSVKVENGTNPNIQLRNKDPRIGLDWRADGLGTTSSNSVSNDALDPLAATQGKSPSPLGSGELTSRRACQDGEEDDVVTQGNTSQGDEADESESKRRKKEMFSAEAYLPSRSNREPRVIVKIETEIDVLDDGYRWRKYGQKVVKGNPNPRSYYKCTSAGCPVRKHVERASEDIKTVLTTYEGKHNHEVPTSKTSGLHSTFNSPPDGSNSAVSRNPNIATREIKVQDLPLHYEMKSEFLRSNFLGDFVSDIQIGPPSLYPMKFPPTPSLQTSMPFSPYMMNGNGGPAMLDFPLSIPLNGPNMPLNNTFQHPYNHINHGMQSGTAMQTSIGDQSMKDGDLRFLRPKEEKRDETLSVDTCMTTPENSNVASSTPFCMVMGNFPS